MLIQIPEKKRFFRLTPVTITITYLALGFFWIAFSDLLLEQWIENPARLNDLQTLKGWIYVSITGLLLFILISRYKKVLVRTRLDYLRKFDQFKALLAHANQIIIQVDQKGEFRYVNPVINDLLGYEEPYFRSMEDLDTIVHTDDKKRFQEIREYWSNSKIESLRHQIRLRHNNGTWRWFLLIASDERRIRYVESGLLIVRDIQEETTLYEKLRESKDRFEHLFQEAPVGYHSIDSNMLIVAVNDTELNILGYRREEIVGTKTWADLIVSEDQPLYQQHLKDLLERGKADNYSYTVLRKDGEKRSVILNARAFFDKDGRLIYTLGNVLDVTEKMVVKRHLHEAYNRLSYHIQNTPLGFMEWDAGYRILDWSETSEKLFGWSKEEVLGNNIYDRGFVHPDDRERVSRELKELMNGRRTNVVIQYRNVAKNGRVLECEWYTSVLQDSEGNIITIMSLAHDITEWNRALRKINTLNATLEKRVRERTKELEAVNKELESFAYSISHDLKAPLRGIDGFSLALLEQHGKNLDESGKNYLERVRTATQKMGDLIEDILSLSRITRLKFSNEHVDLAAITGDIIANLKAGDPDKNAEIRLPEFLMVSGDANLLTIMMQNLLENAWKFSSTREVIRIEMGVDEIKGDRVIFIKDNGVGFNRKYYDKLFTAFQRLHSREEFPGSGIGLATVQRIVHRHSGKIWAESEENKGTTFFFTLSEIITDSDEKAG